MSTTRPRSSEKASAEVIVLENLRNWRQQFDDNPLDPEVIRKGMLTLSDIGESALIQAVKYGKRVDAIYESQNEISAKLGSVQGKLDTAISRFEGSKSVQDNENESVAAELREVKEMVRAIIDHFGIKVHRSGPEGSNS